MGDAALNSDAGGIVCLADI